MFGFSVLLPLLAGAASLFTQVDAGRTRPINYRGAETNSYIVEFAGGTSNDVSDNLGTVLAPDAFSAQIKTLLDLDIGLHVDLELNYKLFQGAVFSFPDSRSAADGLTQLASHKGVKEIWPNHPISRGSVQAANKIARRDQVSANNNSSYRGFVDPADRNLTNMAHVLSQVNKLHEKGIYGNGTRICVIDHGVDYTHPALGDGYGPGHVIGFGRDLVGDNYSSYPANSPMPDNDPFSNCDPHGTISIGVIATQPTNPFGMIGVAPGATIGAYRILSCRGEFGTSTALMVQAMYMAHEDGCQVINGAFGAPSGWNEGFSTALGTASERIAAAGVPGVYEVYDGGEAGLFHAGDPAGHSGVTCVGSADSLIAPDIGLVANYTVDGGKVQSFKWDNGEPAAWGGVSLPLWAPNYNDTGLDDENEPCTNYFPPGTPDLSGYIVLLHYRNCDASIQAKQAADLGAKYLIQYNNWPYQKGYPKVPDVPGILAAAGVSSATGDGWLKALAAGSTVTVSMADPDTLPNVLTFSEPPTPGAASFFSSWGPTFELAIKPQFLAPGANLLTIWPEPYVYLDSSATSWAGPYMAGVYALIAQARGTWDPATIESLLSATAVPVPYSDDTTMYPQFYAPAFKQGGGVIRAFDAAFSTTLLSISSIALNDTEHLNSTQSFTIKNLGTEDVTFTLGHTAAGTAYTLPGDEFRPATFKNIQLVADAATVEFAGGSQVDVPAGGESTVSVTITPPSNVDTRRLPMYSGWITLNGTSGENLSLPYGGAAFRMRDVEIFSEVRLCNWTTELGWDIKPDQVPALDGDAVYVYTLPYNETDVHDNITYPIYFIELAFGTRLLEVQVVAWDGVKDTEPGTIVGTVQYARKTYTTAYDPVYPNPDTWWDVFDGTLEDGSYIPEGTYVMQAKALKIFGDPDAEADYEFRRTPPFTMRYTYGGAA